MIQYEETLTSVYEEVLSFESDENGFIKEEFLKDELKSELVKASTSLTSTSIDINQQLLYVKEIVDVSPVDSEPFFHSINKGKEKLSTTLSNMYDMDANATKKLDQPQQDIEQMQAYLAKLRDAIDKNNISVDTFNITQFNNEFFTYHDAFKLDAKGRHALATGEKAELTQDDFNSLFPFIKSSESVMDSYEEWNGTYHTLKDDRIIREYPTKDGPRYEFVDKIPNSRAEPPKSNLVLDILGPAWKDLVDSYTEDYITIADPEASWEQRSLAVLLVTPWGNRAKHGYKFGISKNIKDIETLSDSKATKSTRFKAGVSLFTLPGPVKQTFEFSNKYINPVMLKNGGFLAKKTDGGKKSIDKPKGNKEKFHSSNLKPPELLDELKKSGVKYTPDEVMAVTKTPNGKLVWLEKGNSKAGLDHVMNHADEFAQKGIKSEEIPELIINSLSNGELVGYQGRGKGRPIYELEYKGKKQRVAITVGNNGFIVGANPASIK